MCLGLSPGWGSGGREGHRAEEKQRRAFFLACTHNEKLPWKQSEGREPGFSSSDQRIALSSLLSRWSSVSGASELQWELASSTPGIRSRGVEGPVPGCLRRYHCLPSDAQVSAQLKGLAPQAGPTSPSMAVGNRWLGQLRSSWSVWVFDPSA